jgi:hypothetical protein
MAFGGSGTQGIASTPNKMQYFLCEAEVQLIILRKERVLGVAECRLLNGVFVFKMRGVNGGRNVNFGSFLENLIVRFLLRLASATIINQKRAFRRLDLSQSSGWTLMTTVMA